MTVGLTWDTDIPEGVRADALERAGLAALAHAGGDSKQVDLILVEDSTLTELHARFLADDTPTDVMAFDLGEDGEGPAGEVYVSVDCALRVAASRGVGVERELALYVVHGCLHLCGLDDHDEADRARMRKAEASVLQALGYPADSGPHERLH